MGYKLKNKVQGIYLIEDLETSRQNFYTDFELLYLLQLREDYPELASKLNIDGVAMNESGNLVVTSKRQRVHTPLGRSANMGTKVSIVLQEEQARLKGEGASEVSLLYALLNDKAKVSALQRYYLWYSRRIFNLATPIDRLKLSKAGEKKAKELDLLRGSSQWVYAGYVDKGVTGEDFCTLKHPLRYVHLAWDINKSDLDQAFFGETTYQGFDEIVADKNNHCIKFGIKCIADFFEVDPETTSALGRAQRMSLKDMSLLYEAYTDTKTPLQEKLDSFKVMDEMVDYLILASLKGALLYPGYKAPVEKSILDMYKSIRDQDMLPPYSLVQAIRDGIIGWKNHKFSGHLRRLSYKDFELKYPNFVKSELQIEDEFKMVYPGGLIALFLASHLTRMVDAKYLNLRTIESFNSYVTLWFMDQIMGMYAFDGNKYTDEGGASQTVLGELRWRHLVSGLSPQKNRKGYELMQGVAFDFETLNKIDQIYRLLYAYKLGGSEFKIPKIDFSPMEKKYVVLGDSNDEQEDVVYYKLDRWGKSYEKEIRRYPINGVFSTTYLEEFGLSNVKYLDFVEAVQYWSTGFLARRASSSSESVYAKTSDYFKGQTFDEVIADLSKKVKSIDAYLQEYQAFALKRVMEDCEQKNISLARRREENEKLEAKIQKEKEDLKLSIEKEKLAKEAKKKKKEVVRVVSKSYIKPEHAEKQTAKKNLVVTRSSFIDHTLEEFMFEHLDYASGKYGVGGKILVTLSKSKKKPTSKQLYYINALCKSEFGFDYLKEFHKEDEEDEVVVKKSEKLTDYPEYVKAVEFVLDRGNESGLKPYELRILTTVKRYNKMSEKQKVFVLLAKDVYDRDKNK